MEALSNDVILIILRKLALQDPLSLLRATEYACKSLGRTAEENSCLWILPSGRKCSLVDQTYILVSTAKTSALKRTDLGNGNGTDLDVKQTQESEALVNDVLSLTSPSDPVAIERLVVMREGGRLLIWGLSIEKSPPCHLLELGDVLDTWGPDPASLNLFLSTCQLELTADFERPWYEREYFVKVVANGRRFLRETISMELYEFVQIRSEPRARSSLEGQDWSCRLMFTKGGMSDNYYVELHEVYHQQSA